MRRGFLWVDYGIIDDRSITSSDKVVYVMLARFVGNDTQECYPSNKKLSETTGLTTRTIVNSIRHLEERGYVEVDRKSGKVNYYQLNRVGEKSSLVKNDNSTSEKRIQVPVKNKHTNNTYNNNTYNNNIGKMKKLKEKTTPAEEMKLFLEDKDFFQRVVESVVEKIDASEEYVVGELKAFRAYWSELNKSGTKQRWEFQPTFQLNRRIATWLRNGAKFRQSKGKSIGISI